MFQRKEENVKYIGRKDCMQTGEKHYAGTCFWINLYMGICKLLIVLGDYKDEEYF